MGQAVSSSSGPLRRTLLPAACFGWWPLEPDPQDRHGRAVQVLIPLLGAVIEDGSDLQTGFQTGAEQGQVGTQRDGKQILRSCSLQWRVLGFAAKAAEQEER